jgi:hypothetical protein
MLTFSTATSAAEAAIKANCLTAAVKRCATQNRFKLGDHFHRGAVGERLGAISAQGHDGVFGES